MTVNRIPKPKPKIEKPQKEESESGESVNANTSDTTAEGNSSQTEQSTEDPAGSSNNQADSETEVHDELWSYLHHDVALLYDQIAY